MDLTGQALVLAALGLPVFPCGQDKRPHAKDWPDAATRDPGVIVRWFRPGELIGIVCGPRSGLAVLDVDVPKHPEAGLWLDANRARLPGRVFQTRSGGWHLYFRWVPGVVNCAGRPVPGIDTRGEGGFVIWWGGEDLGRASPQGLAEWPEWLRVLIWPPPVPVARKPLQRPMMRWRTRDCLAPFLHRLQRERGVGCRNSVLYWCAKRAKEHVEAGLIHESYARGQLTAVARSVFKPEEWFEIDRTIDSAFRGGN